MKSVVCAVFDQCVGEFMSPFVIQTTAAAVRSFSQAVSDSTSGFAQSPRDYALFQLAEFDSETGMFSNLDICQRLIQAVDVVPSGVNHGSS